MAEVIPFPDNALARVDRLCRAVAERMKGPRELIEHGSRPGSVFVRVAGLELYLTPQEARGLAEDLADAADDAESMLLQGGGRRG